ncbi:MAG TPA: tRNA-intron lyase [Nitrososphaerales archaeon]|nr:tRNA-intron lyase [Nitrososphaerales archaeon]
MSAPATQNEKSTVEDGSKNDEVSAGQKWESTGDELIPEATEAEERQQFPKRERRFPPRQVFGGKGQQEQEIQQEISAVFSKKLKHAILERPEDTRLLESKGFGIREGEQFYLKDYEVLYLMYTGKLKLRRGAHQEEFTDYVNFALTRDENAWTRFLVFRDLRSRGYVVREGFGFPIDFRVYERGDYGEKAAKYIVFGLNEGKTMSVGELKKHIEEMTTMGKEAVIAVVERRGEVIYYKVGKWRPLKSA